MTDRHANALLALIAVGVAVAASLWFAATVAAGFHPPPGGLANVAGAVGHLRENATHPGDAWTPAIVLNPIVFWLSEALLVAGTVVATCAIYQRMHGGSRRRPLGVAPSTGVTRRLPALQAPNPAQGRLTLGRTGRALVVAEPSASLAVVGPTGCGKTAGLVIPALLEWDGPILAVSVKTDLLDATLRHRNGVGTVDVYDPTELVNPSLRSGWSPLDHCDSWQDAQRTAAWLCDAARAASIVSSEAEYWMTQARLALAPYLYTARAHGCDLAEMVQWIDVGEQDGIAKLLLGDPHPDTKHARVAFDSLWLKEERHRSSLYGTVQTVLAAYTDPGVQRAAELPRRINFDRWLAGNNTIYLVAPAHEQQRLRAVFTALAQAAIRASYNRANTHGGTLPKPCLIVLDEAGNTAPLPDLATYATTARSHGITLVTVWQDLAQLDERYGRHAQTVLNNHRARVFGGGIADEHTLRYLSTVIGDVEHREQRHSVDLTSGRRTVTEHHHWRPAAPIDELRRLPADNALLLYGNEPAARIQLRPWFRDRTLTARSHSDDTR